MKQYIRKLENKENLASYEIKDVMRLIMSGEAGKDEMADFLLALRTKGPTIDEITGAAEVMRQFVVGVKTNHNRLLDTCGTGGDKKHTFNISTLAAFVVAAAGVAVAKHGNRSVSSKCGSADVLEALGVKLDLDHERLSECLDKIGIVFLFAQKHHPAMKHIAPVRKELGVETIFNVLGPLTNPARATHQMMGVYNRDLVEPMAQVLKNLGLSRAMVVHGADGLDEVTTTAKTFISEYNGKDILSYTISPDELDLPFAKESDLTGGDLKVNLEIFLDILGGQTGPKTDIVVLNAACALYVADKVKGIADGITIARQMLESGQARQKLEELKRFTHQ